MSKHQFKEIRVPIEVDNVSIMRDEEKCIKCGQCKRICTEEIGIAKMFDLDKTNDIAICINCGQCANVCPVSSITEVYEYDKVKEAINNPDKVVIFSTSPSVRVAIGEEFGMELGTYAEDKMVSALRKLGANYVLDTTFAADLTIIEEASELIERITKKTKPLPQFTSCCPAWVNFVETFYPQYIDNLSTAKSPIGMQGPTIKTYFAHKMGINVNDIVNVAVTPCTAKKFEIRRDEMNDSAEYNNIDNLRDMDFVITTRELAKWINEENINFNDLEPSTYDSLMERGTGAGIIFGNTGGVMEAAVRTAYYYLTNNQPTEGLYNLQAIRGLDGVKEAAFKINDTELKIAVIHGTENARLFIEKMESEKLHFDFVEVMTCRGGCIGGGGQPKDKEFLGDKLREKRIKGLYDKDADMELRNSYENPDIIEVYKQFYNKPLSDLAEKMLHTSYNDKSSILSGSSLNLESNNEKIAATYEPLKYICKVCGYIVESDSLPNDFICPICGKGKDYFKQI